MKLGTERRVPRCAELAGTRRVAYVPLAVAIALVGVGGGCKEKASSQTQQEPDAGASEANWTPGPTPEQLKQAELDRAKQSREARFATLESGDYSLMTPEELCLRAWAHDNLHWCPEVKKVEAREPADEFEEKDKDRDLVAAKEACIKTRKDALPSLPAIAVYEIGINIAASKYDFERKGFSFQLEDRSEKRNRLVHAEDDSLLIGDDAEFLADPGPLRSFFKEFDQLNCGYHVNNLYLEGCRMSLFFSYPARSEILMKVDEDQARTMKPRFVEEARLRVQVAFEPKDYGLTPFSKGGYFNRISAFRGTCIGYRVVDDSGVVIPWVPATVRP